MFAPSISIALLAAALSFASQGSARLVVDGREVAPDVKPVAVQGAIFVPLRFIAEALGARVSWDARTQSATIRGNGHVVTTGIGTPVVLSDRRKLTSRTPPRVIAGRTMVPL